MITILHILKDYYSYKQKCREDRIRYFNVVFYNTETGDRISPHLRYKHDNIAAKSIYYSVVTYPDVLLKEKLNIMQNSYNANNIYEWNIDGDFEYNILTILQQMTMVAKTYRITHGFTDQLFAHILITRFTG